MATLHLVFKSLDIEAFEAALRGWAQGQLGDGEETISRDGKGLRGIHGEELPGVRPVAAYATRAGLVLAQSGVRRDEHQVRLSIAPRLPPTLPLAGSQG